MKIGLLGDIHGNDAALRAVLAGARRESVDYLLLTGDYVGYYYAPGAVLDALEEWPHVMVRGNHEAMLGAVLAEPVRLEGITRAFGHGLALAVRDLGEARARQLVELPSVLHLELAGLSLCLAHGTPWDADAYLYPDADAARLRRFREVEADFIVLGHTHYPMQLQAHDRTIINPGSVGQPRDRNPGAAWALLDSRDGRCHFHREAYDAHPVSQLAARIDPELPYLREVLHRR